MGRGFLGGRGSDFESTGVSLINKCTVKRMEGRFFSNLIVVEGLVVRVHIFHISRPASFWQGESESNTLTLPSPHFTFEFPSLSHKLSASDHESSPDPSQPFLIT